MSNLKKVLLINATSSGATGILLVIFNQYLADLFGTPHAWAVSEVGIFLIFFAGLVFITSLQEPIKILFVKLIVSLDCLWVAASLLIVSLGLFKLSTIGYALITAVGLWVALMAFLQYKSLKLTTSPQ
ncbi:hypothetical protein GCM10011514_51280 [Emticicia aquatilis]|uniref:Uncharacterized protein n=1 Tax=Emticicia aquatilis TaxID=1537369 RepID=A0A916Z7R6_9BACT|nr:hypothetical protein [Emticicia aquatilis]GGD80894.1 hypothetical protein GCM10011514_51280 [Emticicia aquatilis]